ncbi:MAG: N-acetylmannosamine-6-phosphate 2-epimerase [Subdoligranulum sp.]
MTHEQIFNQIKGGLIVSCQALEHEPLYTKEGGVMPLMAKAAAQSGAVGIRANTVRDITQIKQVVDLPGHRHHQKDYPGTPMYITVTMKEVDELVARGVDSSGRAGTGALRPNGQTSAEFIRAKSRRSTPTSSLWPTADNIERAGLARGPVRTLLGTTMRGYTPGDDGHQRCGLRLYRPARAECPAGSHRRGSYPHAGAGRAGALRRCVRPRRGGAITRPAEITRPPHRGHQQTTNKQVRYE